MDFREVQAPPNVMKIRNLVQISARRPGRMAAGNKTRS
jgi:hypothetical protein